MRNRQRRHRLCRGVLQAAATRCRHGPPPRQTQGHHPRPVRADLDRRLDRLLPASPNTEARRCAPARWWARTRPRLGSRARLVAMGGAFVDRRPSPDPDSRGAAVLSDFRKLAQGYLQMPWRSLSFRHSSRCPRHQQRLRAVCCGTASHLPQMPAPATAGVTGGFRSKWRAHTYATPPRSSPPARLHGHSALQALQAALAGRPVLMPTLIRREQLRRSLLSATAALECL